MKTKQTRLKTILKEKGYTNKTKLAKLLNMSPQRLYSLLKDDISLKTIELIGDKLNVKVKDFFKD